MADHQEGLQAAVAELRRGLEEMTARLAELERAVRPPEGSAPREDAGAARAGGVHAPEKVHESVPEEILLVISAAVGAFLGERVRVRQVRLISSPAWGLQGRASIQASHKLDR